MVPDFNEIGEKETEKWLRSEIENIDFIGQLRLSEDDFRSLCDFMRGYLWRGQILYKRIPSAIFVTSMVFAARYSNVNARNFWQPYFELVWGKATYSQTEYKKLSTRFRQSILQLEEDFDLFFPQRTAGDVVRPVYRHAIIPFYLQDDFAEWVKGRWKEILQIPPEELITQLQLDNSYRYLSATLRNFIENKQTSETAQELLITISTAAAFFAEGESAEMIDEMLSLNLIHRSLWQELLNVIREHDEEVKARKNLPKIEWVWSRQDSDLVLRVRNLTGTSNELPDRIVWVAPNQDPNEAEIFEKVLPWKTADGWLIDDTYLDQGSLEGQIVLIGERESILEIHPVPSLAEDQPIMIFSLAEQHDYCVSVNLDSNLISDGYWIISMRDDVKLLGEDEVPLIPLEHMPVPDILSAVGHHNAGVFDLELPISIYYRELLLAEYSKKKKTGGKPIIYSNNSSKIPNLSGAVPPCFDARSIYLRVPQVPNYVLRTGKLWLRNSSNSEMFSISSLRNQGAATLTEGDLVISLGDLIPDDIATYRVQILIGLQPLFPSPLQFGYLPGVGINPPNIENTYSPKLLPTCLLEGIEDDQLVVRSEVDVSQLETGQLQVRWNDLEYEPRLMIQSGNERVLLVWDIKRVVAALKPDQNEYTLEEYKNSELQILSTDETITDCVLSIDEHHRGRDIQLNSKGQYSTKIMVDPSYDLVREHSSSELELFIQMGSAKWTLGRIRKEINLEKIHMDVTSRQGLFLLSIDCEIEHKVEGTTQFIASPLLLPSQSLILHETNHLSRHHQFPLDLPKGFYYLQIKHQGKEVLNTPRVISLLSNKDTLSNGIAWLRPYLSGRKISKMLPEDLQSDFVRFANITFQHLDISDYPDLLFRLLTLPYSVLKERSINSPFHESPSLQGVFAAQERNLARRDDGLFPSWVILDRPLNLMLILPVRRIPIKVFPIISSHKATRGIGVTYIKVRGRKKEADPIYIKWDIQKRKDQFNVFMGLPENNEPSTYLELDELDVWPLKQCKGCGTLLVTRRTSKDEPLYATHKHLYSKPRMRDITYDIDLIAQPSISKVKENLRHSIKIQDWLPTRNAIDIVKSQQKSNFEVSDNPIAADAFLKSIQELSTLPPEEKQYVKDWQTAPSWQESFSHLEDMLTKGQIAIAEYGPLKRMIPLLKNNGESELLILAQQFLFLALLLRGHAHTQSQMIRLMEKIKLTREDLVEMVEMSEAISPRLFKWGLAWAETFFIHALS